ncbi:MAG: hypothetical protein PF489_13240 [Salinivirgaceae bacterium]|jgi:hypothetical protein|nr:hypothetical protein [Salinivirgaceae bacterium]
MSTKQNINDPHLKQNPFAAPPNYFEGLQNDVLAQVSPAKSKVRFLNAHVVRYAAAVLLVAIGSLWLFTYESTSQQDMLANALAVHIDAYDVEMLEYYAETGTESELADEADLYLVNSAYVSDDVLLDLENE